MSVLAVSVSHKTTSMDVLSRVAMDTVTSTKLAQSMTTRSWFWSMTSEPGLGVKVAAGPTPPEESKIVGVLPIAATTPQKCGCQNAKLMTSIPTAQRR